jgi:hypothetical protein
MVLWDLGDKGLPIKLTDHDTPGIANIQDKQLIAGQKHRIECSPTKLCIKSCRSFYVVLYFKHWRPQHIEDCTILLLLGDVIVRLLIHAQKLFLTLRCHVGGILTFYGLRDYTAIDTMTISHRKEVLVLTYHLDHILILVHLQLILGQTSTNCGCTKRPQNVMIMKFGEWIAVSRRGFPARLRLNLVYFWQPPLECLLLRLDGQLLLL